ncbi:MAG: ATP-binding cassette domain-containing protein, partial [Actinomycetota bacterium]
RLSRAFELFPKLEARAGQAAGTLSGGEQQMLVFARALMSEPELLLVDELSLGLAPMLVAQLFDAIERVNRTGTTVLLVEQFVHLALKHSARAYVLARGEVAVEGRSEDLLASPELMAAYLGAAEERQEVSGNGHAGRERAAAAVGASTGSKRPRGTRPGSDGSNRAGRSRRKGVKGR